MQEQQASALADHVKRLEDVMACMVDAQAMMMKQLYPAQIIESLLSNGLEPAAGLGTSGFSNAGPSASSNVDVTGLATSAALGSRLEGLGPERAIDHRNFASSHTQVTILFIDFSGEFRSELRLSATQQYPPIQIHVLRLADNARLYDGSTDTCMAGKNMLPHAWNAHAWKTWRG